MGAHLNGIGKRRGKERVVQPRIQVRWPICFLGAVDLAATCDLRSLGRPCGRLLCSMFANPASKSAPARARRSFTVSAVHIQFGSDERGDSSGIEI